MNVIKNRYDFALIFDVTNGNPNGDPDAVNSPRVDPETGRGLISDVCLKRKIRNYVTLARRNDKGEPAIGYDIYVKEKAILNLQHQRAFDSQGVKNADATKKEDLARKFMCQNFFDIRMFGAVMTTGVNCGQVRGPVQFTFANSIEPIVALEQSITRMAVTTEKEAEKQEGGNRTMGRKTIIPYALYVTHGFISPFLAQDTGFSDDDLSLLWQALKGMFDLDRSAARGEMSTRRLIVFRHDSGLGNAPAYSLLERVKINRNNPSAPARAYSDYQVVLENTGLPAGITIIEP